MLRSLNRGMRQNRRGAAMIEFHALLLIMAVLMAAIINFSWYMSRSEAVMRSARDGARRGASTVETSSESDGNSIIPASNNAIDVTLNGLGLGSAGCARNTTVFRDGNDLKVIRTSVSCPFLTLFDPLNTFSYLPTDIRYEFTMYAEVQ